MNYKFFAVFVILLFALTGTAHASLTDDLVSYYGFEESSGNLIDLHGSNDGSNSNVTYRQTGKIDYAYSYNGSTSKTVLTGYKGITGTNARSFSMWFKTNDSGDNYLLSYGASSTTTDGTGWQITLEDGVVWQRTYDGRVASWGSGYADNSWHHLVMTFPSGGDLSDVLVYVNGSAVSRASINNDGAINTGNNLDVHFGFQAIDAVETNRLNGYLDELGIWETVLSAEDVNALYNSGNGLAYPFIDANTTFSYERLGGGDVNITLSCESEVLGCKAINYNVNNEGWNGVYAGNPLLDDFEDGNYLTNPTWEVTGGTALIINDTTMQGNYFLNINEVSTIQTTDIDYRQLADFNFMFRSSITTSSFHINIINLKDDSDVVLCSIKQYGTGTAGTGRFKYVNSSGSDTDIGSTSIAINTNYFLRISYDYSTAKCSYYSYDSSGNLLNNVINVNATNQNNNKPNKLELKTTGNPIMGIDYIQSYISELDNLSNYSFIYSGSGDHNIQYFSTDNTDNNESIKTSSFTTYGHGKFTFYDEDDDSLLNDVIWTVSPAINGVSGGTLTDSNVLSLNLQGISPTNYTFTFNKTGYGTRYYTQTLTELSEFDLNFLMLPSASGRNIEFQVYQSDETTLYTNTYIYLFNWNKQMGGVGRRQTDSSGKVTFFVNPNDANYTMRIFGATTIDYNSMTLTVNKPRDESDGEIIVGNWDLKVTGLAWQNYTDITGDQNIQIYANTTDDYALLVGDSDANYFDRKYYVSYVGGTTSESIQPYLVPIDQAVSTTIFTISGYTQQPAGNITIKIYKTIIGVGRVLVEQVTTDSKGEALISLIANDEYEFEIFDGVTKLGQQSYRVTSTSTTIYISIDDLGITTPILGQGLVSVLFAPRRTHLIGSDTTITQTISIVDQGLGLEFVNALIYITNTDINGVRGNDSNIYTTTITSLTNSIAFNSTNKTIGGVAYDNNGSLIIHVIVNTNQGTYYAKYVYKPPAPFDYFQELGYDIRPTFGCPATNDPLIPCGPMLFIALFISILITIAFAIETGFTGQEAMAGLFLVIMGIFTFLAWVPIGLMGLLTVSVIMLMIAIGGRNKI